MSFTNCPPSSTASIVIEFANNNTAFMEAFGPAFQKLIQNGYRENELVTAREVTPVTSPSPTPSSAGNVQAVYLLITFAFTVLMVLL